MAGVRLEHVTKAYGKKIAVEDLNMEFKEGELFSIVGAAGAGKSTILKMIAGIEKPTSGTIYFNERSVNDLPPQRRNVAMAFETYNLYPHLTVYKNIAFPLTTPKARANLTRRQERERVEEIADFLGIKRLLDRKPVQLSGGEKQRVSLARAMVRKAQVYLLDEPIAHLDARLKFSTQKSLKRMSRKMGTAIIYVTHDYREALGLSNRVAVLNNGRVEQVGTPKEIFDTPATDFVARFIGDPPTNLMDGEILKKDGQTCFRTADFDIEIQKDLIEPLESVVEKEGGKSTARMGIRSFHIRVAGEKKSRNAFQLPIYAIFRTPEGTMLTFELEHSFLQVSLEGQADFGMSDKVWLDFDQDHMLFFKKTIKIAKM
jgi:multiple sugar transport system ATP-binding protein